MGDLTPPPSLYLQKKVEEKESKPVIEEAIVQEHRSDLRPRWMKNYQDRNLKEDFESEPANVVDLANDITLKSDIMGRVLKGVALNSRFKTAHEPSGEPLPRDKEVTINTDDFMGNPRNVSTDPLTQGEERDDAMIHYPDGKEREAVPEKELTIVGKNKIVLTYEEAQKIIENLLVGVTIEWK